MFSFSPSLSQNARQAVGRGHVPGRQRSERRHVERFDVSHRRDPLAVLVHQQDDACPRFLTEPTQDLSKAPEVLFEEDQIGRRHRFIVAPA